MKAVHYLPSLNLSVGGGVTRSVLDMAGVLAEAGQDITVMTHERGDAPDTWGERGDAGTPKLILVDRPDRPLGRFTGKRREDIFGPVREADLLHMHAVWSPANLQLAKAARKAGKPYVITLHGMLGGWSMSQKTLKKKLFLAMGGRAYLDHAARVLFSCEEERNQASNWFDARRGAVHPLPLALDIFDTIPSADTCRSELSIPDDGLPTLLFFSTLKPVKGVEFVIDGVDQLRKGGLDCRLLIAGKGDDDYEQMLRSRVQQLGLNDRVQFVGYVRGQTKVGLLALADVNVFVSEHENFGFAWAESMAAGTPVVISKGVGPWRELVEGGGAVIAQREGASVADACRPLLTDEKRRKELGDIGHAFVRRFLDPERVAGQIISIYQQAQAGDKS